MALEEGVHSKANKTNLKEFLSFLWKNPYILRLAFSTGIGGILFGYDNGVISGALLYVRDDFDSVDKNIVLQETIVSMATAGAILGALNGGWMSDRFGRRNMILVSNVMFLIGAIIMAAAPYPSLIILGRIIVGLGIGMVSMCAPLYLSEASPVKIRGALISTFGLLITGGLLLSFLVNLAFTKVRGTWRWMLGVGGIPAVVQFILMWTLPESPRWLYRKKRYDEANNFLRKICSAHEVDQEIEALRLSVSEELAEEGSTEKFSFIKLLKNNVVRKGLIAGVGLQVAMQFMGIHSVIYYSPIIVQFAGFDSNQTALRLSLITIGLNALGALLCIFFIDKVGRRKLLLMSLTGIILSLMMLTVVFDQASTHTPSISRQDTAHFGNYTCPDYKASPVMSWECVKCLKATSGCGFCAQKGNVLRPGACLLSNKDVKDICHGEHRSWYSHGCPSPFGWLALVGLTLYILSFSPGMGNIPWIINSEIYPLRYRGVCGGIAATANWVCNLIVSQTFLTLTQALGTAWTFLLFALLSALAMVFVLFFVPETRGLSFEEVEKMLQSRNSLKFWKKSVDQSQTS